MSDAVGRHSPGVDLDAGLLEGVDEEAPREEGGAGDPDHLDDRIDPGGDLAPDDDPARMRLPDLEIERPSGGDGPSTDVDPVRGGGRTGHGFDRLTGLTSGSS